MTTALETFIAAVRSMAAYVAVSLYVLVAGPIGMLLALLFHWKGILYILGHGGVALGTSLAGIRYRVAGREHVPPDRAVVFCANHQSNVDPPVLYRALHPRLHILYKAELQKLPVLGRAFGLGGFVPVDRASREHSVAAIEQAAQSLCAGNSFLTFPEGTRSRTGALLPFKKGGFILAIKAQVPIVPVAVQGGTAAMRKGSAIIRPVTVSVRIGAPIETAGLRLSERDDLIARVRAGIEGLLAQGEIEG
jgi:1-acyl-sn-glycerol-3-phosphate acyltransferase